MTQEAGISKQAPALPFRVAFAPRTIVAGLLLAAFVVGVGVGYLAASMGREADGAAAAAASSDRLAYLLVGLLAMLVFGAGAAVVGAALGRQRTQDAALARTSWRLDFALAASAIGVWDVDLATDELLWDDRARMLFGVDARRGFFSEADWVATLHPDDRDRAVTAAHAAVAGGGRFAFDYRIVLPDGNIRNIRDIAAVYRGTDGSHRLVGLVWDVTPDVERQQELELRRAEAEAATLAKSRFLAAMSHEIRTPMTGVLGLLDLMLAEPLPDRQRERATIALASARGLLAILNDVLDFSKLEADRVGLVPQAVDPREIVSEVIKLMGPVAERKGLRLGWSASEAVPRRVITDPMRFRQVLTNLVSNATKFTESGRIDVSLGYSRSVRGGVLSAEVEDTGIGIPERMFERLFEEFVQGDDSISRRHGGTGLGLSISKRLVELMGGRISVRSTPGAGSVFDFEISAPPADVAAGQASGTISRLEPRAAAPLRILVAEDNATNQYLIRAYLEAQGHTVTTVENGVEALRSVATRGFDVVLMDVQMPELDGCRAARAIRALPAPASEIAIVALTANALPWDRESCLAAGMDDFVSKPIDFNALDRAVRRARDRGRG